MRKFFQNHLLSVFLFGLMSVSVFAQTKDEVKVMRKKLASATSDNREKVDLLLQFGNYVLAKPGELKADLDSASAHFQRAFKLSKSLDYKKGIAQSTLLEARILREKGSEKQAYDRFSKTISFARESELLADQAEAMTEYAKRWKTTPEELPNKMEEQRKALGIYARLGAKGGKPYAVALKDMADFHQMYGENQESIDYLEKSLAISKAIKDGDTQGTYVLLANNYRHIGNFEKALPIVLKAQEIAEANHDRSEQMAMIYNHIAIICDDLKKFDRALEYFEKALEVAKENNDRDNISKFWLSIATIHKQRKNYKRTVEILNEMAKKYPPKSLDRIVRQEVMFTVTYCEMGETEKARPHFEKLLRIEDQVVREGVYVGDLYPAVIKYLQASHQPLKSYEYIEKYRDYHKNTSNLIFQANVEQLYFLSDSASGKYLDAIKHLRKYKTLTDSFSNAEKMKQFSEMEIKFETRQKDKNIQLLRKQGELQQTKIENDKITRYIFIGFVVVLVVVIGLILNRYRLKQRINKKLESQQEEINAQNDLLKKLVSEKEWLLKEIHHRVKNNLQIVISLLNTQSAYLENEDAIQAIQNSQHRMHAMSLIHQKLYQSENLSKIDMGWYIHELVSYLKDSFESTKRINYKVDTDSLELDVAQAVPVGLILNEAINNSIKYAFPDVAKGAISISLKNIGNEKYQLTIQDNGVGLPENFNLAETDSLGMNLMQGLASQLQGEFSLQNQDGLKVQIQFKKNTQLPEQERVPNEDERKDFTG
ncbi:histidine kinase dimerization/phosphoacceptor domain -containing protein [Flavobacterium sp.]|uniref:histidine kinase dimerization/phosphoacceptor domain -containing protein n=1 Tax=Flavobacterium sp. TaxID=239 RepID=UPI0025B852BB|nr:histidine kinase dimerization/phosphoacceptor domain -containing protein [Flavobacterium sp.]